MNGGGPVFDEHYSAGRNSLSPGPWMIPHLAGYLFVGHLASEPAFSGFEVQSRTRTNEVVWSVPLGQWNHGGLWVMDTALDPASRELLIVGFRWNWTEAGQGHVVLSRIDSSTGAILNESPIDMPDSSDMRLFLVPNTRNALVMFRVPGSTMDSIDAVLFDHTTGATNWGVTFPSYIEFDEPRDPVQVAFSGTTAYVYGRSEGSHSLLSVDLESGEITGNRNLPAQENHAKDMIRIDYTADPFHSPALLTADGMGHARLVREGSIAAIGETRPPLGSVDRDGILPNTTTCGLAAAESTASDIETRCAATVAVIGTFGRNLESIAYHLVRGDVKETRSVVAGLSRTTNGEGIWLLLRSPTLEPDQAIARVVRFDLRDDTCTGGIEHIIPAHALGVSLEMSADTGLLTFVAPMQGILVAVAFDSASSEVLQETSYHLELGEPPIFPWLTPIVLEGVDLLFAVGGHSQTDRIWYLQEAAATPGASAEVFPSCSRLQE